MTDALKIRDADAQKNYQRLKFLKFSLEYDAQRIFFSICYPALIGA